MADIEALDGEAIGNHRLRLVELASGIFAEQYHFKLHLETGDRLSDRPVFHGMASSGRASQHVAGWIDGFYGGQAHFGGARITLADEGIEHTLMERVGAVIAPGGWLGLAYETLGEDTELLSETRRLLNLGVPAIVTPLGMLLHAAGCGYHIRNWYISEGWREGARRLQGFRPVHEESLRERARETGEALRAFLEMAGESGELAGARRCAEEILTALPG